MFMYEANASGQLCTAVLQALPFDREGLEALLSTGMGVQRQ